MGEDEDGGDCDGESSVVGAEKLFSLSSEGWINSEPARGV
jgi:hypothetical protein